METLFFRCSKPNRVFPCAVSFHAFSPEPFSPYLKLPHLKLLHGASIQQNPQYGFDRQSLWLFEQFIYVSSQFMFDVDDYSAGFCPRTRLVDL